MNSSIAMAPAPSNPASAPNLAGRIFKSSIRRGNNCFLRFSSSGFINKSPALATPPPDDEGVRHQRIHQVHDQAAQHFRRIFP